MNETHNLERLKGAYCRVCGMYIYLFIYRFVQIYGTVSDSPQSLFIYYAWNATCCLHEVVKSLIAMNT